MTNCISRAVALRVALFVSHPSSVLCFRMKSGGPGNDLQLLQQDPSVRGEMRSFDPSLFVPWDSDFSRHDDSRAFKAKEELTKCGLSAEGLDEALQRRLLAALARWRQQGVTPSELRDMVLKAPEDLVTWATNVIFLSEVGLDAAACINLLSADAENAKVYGDMIRQLTSRGVPIGFLAGWTPQSIRKVSNIGSSNCTEQTVHELASQIPTWDSKVTASLVLGSICRSKAANFFNRLEAFREGGLRTNPQLPDRGPPDRFDARGNVLAEGRFESGWRGRAPWVREAGEDWLAGGKLRLGGRIDWDANSVKWVLYMQEYENDRHWTGNGDYVFEQRVGTSQNISVLDKSERPQAPRASPWFYANTYRGRRFAKKEARVAGDIVDGFETHPVWDAKVDSIKKYTNHGQSKNLNKAVREADLAATVMIGRRGRASAMSLATYIDKELEALPPWQEKDGLLYHGTSHQNQIGYPIQLREFWSCTKVEFSAYRGVLQVIIPKSGGRDVSKFSRFRQEEQEVMLRLGTRLIVFHQAVFDPPLQRWQYGALDRFSPVRIGRSLVQWLVEVPAGQPLPSPPEDAMTDVCS